MKKMSNTVFSLLGVGVLLVFLVTLTQAKEVRLSQYPDGYIPMWSEQRGKGHETTLLNTHQIISVTPVFDPELVLSRARSPKAEYLNVLLSSGNTLKIYEDYEEFKKRIRNSL